MNTPLLPYGRQLIEDDDIAAVVAVLKGDWLTQGPNVEAFETAFAARVGARYAVAVNSGTAALHASMFALGIGPGDEVIVPPITFTASANCVLFVGGTPVFADVDPESGLLDPKAVEQKITKRTKAIMAVDYAGHPCDYAALLPLAQKRGLALVCDACHALGAIWNGRPVGSVGALNTFSFHPVKHIATGEGGMITTDDPALAQRMRDFRSHGITKDAARFKGLGACGGMGVSEYRSNSDTPTLRHPEPLQERGPWHYEMHDLGYNYRISDINAALGRSQLAKIDRFVTRRREVAARYYAGLSGNPHLVLPLSDLRPPGSDLSSRHSFHLFPVLIDFAALGKSRTQVMAELRERGVGTQVHYIPVCLQPYYRDHFGHKPGDYPGAETFFARELSIPMYAGLTDADVEKVISAVRSVALTPET